jgi:hypothetical protein
MRNDTRFARPERSEIESKLPIGCLSDPQALGIWMMMLQSDNPSEVSHYYRSYRDSSHCTVPREKIRSMRDTMIASMREANRADNKPRKEKQAGVHYDKYNDGFLKPRKGA